MKILIPTPLRQYAAKKDTVEVPAQTVGEALSSLTLQYSELRRHLYTDDGKLRAFVNLYLNDEDIRYLQKENTPVRDGDTLSIVPSIAGGCCVRASTVPDFHRRLRGIGYGNRCRKHSTRDALQ